MRAPRTFDPNVLCKRKSSRLRKGAPWLKTILVQYAWAATHEASVFRRSEKFAVRKRTPTRLEGRDGRVIGQGIPRPNWHIRIKQDARHAAERKQ
jgi:hypothetical protein